MYRESEENPQIEKFDFFKYDHLLNNKQYREALVLLGEYNRRAVEGQMDVYRLKNQIKNMIYHFLDFLQLGDEAQEEYRKKYFRAVNQSFYAEDYQKCVEDILEEIERLAGQNGQQTDERIDRMLAYIEKNYREDLKLEDLAGEFNFNYHYLSAYFSQQMQEGFSDYLNRVRINKACRLLKERHLRYGDGTRKRRREKRMVEQFCCDNSGDGITWNIMDAIDASWAFRLYLTEGDRFDNVRTFQNIYQMEKDLEQSKASDLERLNILVMGVGGKHYLSRTETITATDQEIWNSRPVLLAIREPEVLHYTYSHGAHAEAYDPADYHYVYQRYLTAVR